MAAADGHQVWLICATNGDEGGAGDESGDHAMDPEIRRNELREACAALGIGAPIFLGYRDSGMETWTPKPGAFVLADRDEVVARIAGEIRKLRPAVVVTFDPGGVYGHPDHVRVSDVATAAFQQTHGEPGGPGVLYHQVVSRTDVQTMLARWQQEAEERGETREPTEDDLIQRQRFMELSRPDDEVTTRVDVRPTVRQKLAALASHASQMRDERWTESPIEELEAMMGEETFVRVVPPPVPGQIETNLIGLD
jgi:N-acetyl-1-D-myo-inositol-2-amino-2-deoxy-alpha-D-glucopyranoside deacetylase